MLFDFLMIYKQEKNKNSSTINLPVLIIVAAVRNFLPFPENRALTNWLIVDIFGRLVKFSFI